MIRIFKKLPGLLLLILISISAGAQDTLPQFSAIDKGGGRVIISWKNPFETVNQIAVQRSYDSVKKFTTVYAAPSPELPQNGYTDKAPPGMKVYYRIFYVLQGGAYFFTKVKRPAIDTMAAAIVVSAADQKRDQATELIKEEIKKPLRKFFIKVADSLYQTLVDGEYLRFKDSIMLRTKDTLFPLNADTILIKQWVRPYEFKASIYVYTDKEGYITISLPEALTRRYELRFIEEDNTPVLELKHVRNTFLKLDKTNFYHAGWYKFELLEDGKVKDRNKVFIPKDF